MNPSRKILTVAKLSKTSAEITFTDNTSVTISLTENGKLVASSEDMSLGIFQSTRGFVIKLEDSKNCEIKLPANAEND